MSKKHERASLPEFDPRLRYPIEVAAAYLHASRAHVFKRIKSGDIAVIRDGRRCYVPGSEIARLSALA